MIRTRGARVVVLLASLACYARSSHAQDTRKAPAGETKQPSQSATSSTGAPTEDARTRAREKFAAARAAHDRGDFEAAARLFEEAHRIAPHASVKFNAAIAWDRAGDLPRAADAYEASLDLGGLEEDQAAEASARLAALKLVLGYIHVLEPVGAMVSVAQMERATIPVHLHVQPGSHRVLVQSATGARAATEVRVGAAEVVPLKLELDTPPAEPSASVEPPSKPFAPAPPQSDRAGATGNQTLWGWVAVSGAVALSGAAIVLGLSALDARDDFEASGRRDVDAHDRAASLRLWTNVAWGGAAVSGATGLYLLLTTPKIEL